MVSPGACVTRGTSQQDRANRGALTSTNVSANLVAKELSARTHLEDTVANVHQDYQEIPILFVKEKLRPSNARHQSPVQVENSALKGNVFAKEGSRGSLVDYAEMWTSVLEPPPKKHQPVVSMPSVKICPEVLIVNALQGSMETHL